MDMDRDGNSADDHAGEVQDTIKKQNSDKRGKEVLTFSSNNGNYRYLYMYIYS